MPLCRRVAEDGQIVQLRIAHNRCAAAVAAPARAAAAATLPSLAASTGTSPCRRVRGGCRRRCRLGCGCRWRAGRCARPLDLAEDVLELHHGRRRRIAVLAQARLHEIVRALALGLIHLLEGDPVARKHTGGNEVPARPLRRRHRMNGLRALFGREARDELVRGLGHAGRRPLPGDSGQAAQRQPLIARRPAFTAKRDGIRTEPPCLQPTARSSRSRAALMISGTSPLNGAQGEDADPRERPAPPARDRRRLLSAARVPVPR